ncbi:SIS domain-containing protein [Arhodomonas sp. AD133]|uniref:SIS domain-containing protein n=1 Tax=Arhodomonas sp. AD133 TaxID=3415009 RepID=UPI003EBB40B7
MVADVNKAAIVTAFDTAVETMERAAELGYALASKVDKIYLVSCGAPNRIMLGLEYWIQHYSPSLEVRRYFPAEFMTQDPARFDERTLVLLGSKSGTTPETVKAAEFLSDRACHTIAVTQTADLPLAKAVRDPLLMGETDEAHTAMFLIMQALIGGLMAEKDGWKLQDKLMRSLAAMPNAMAETQLAAERRAAEDARLLKDDRILYHVASGPMFNTAYVFGICVLMEMQWMHSVPLEAAEFFHGPFEIVDHTTPVVLMLGEDPSRPLMERVERFCKKYTERTFIYDSRDFAMPGIDDEIRPIVAPYIIEAALHRVAARLAVWHNHPLSTRRYMWKTEY